MFFIEAIGAATIITFTSMVGVLFFGHDKRLQGVERFVVPMAVGAFLGLILYELIPETLEASPTWGGLVIFLGFLSFYILADRLHRHFHQLAVEDCDRKGAATLILIGDAIHNFSDGIVLGGAFLVDPAVGFATMVGLILHEVPQEVIEFGVLLRAGYTRWQAVGRNLLSASTIILGTIVVVVLSAQMGEMVWVLTGLAAGNLLFLAASDLLPRIHGNLPHYGNIWYSAAAIMVGFSIMVSLIFWSHQQLGHEHTHEHGEIQTFGFDHEEEENP